MATSGSLFYLNFMNIALSFALSLVIVVGVGRPVGEMLKLIITDIIIWKAKYKRNKETKSREKNN